MSEKGDIKEIDRLDDEARREAMAAAAKEAAEREKAMPFKEVLRIYYPGALWSMFLSTALIMEGYDMG
ncbi:hypothetical protein Q0N58_15090, partial [Staphylococcus aureus]|nr:hypothetical protein [Staphylococcus aureus]